MASNRGGAFGCRHAAHPVWAFAEVISGSGDKTCWKCNFCEKSYTSGGTRLAAHLSHTSGLGIAPCTGGATKESKEAWRAAKKELEEWQWAKNVRAKKLVFAHCNIRALRKVKKVDYESEFFVCDEESLVV